MNRGRGIFLVVALCALAAIALPAAASARTAYFTGEGEIEPEFYSPYVASIDLGTGALGAPLPVGVEGAPSDVAITPDGSTAYVANHEELIVVDVATGAESGLIPMPQNPQAVAIAPDGKHAYTANGDGTVSVIDLSTNTEVGSPIVVGGFLEGIAVTPDGSRAYVTRPGSDAVAVIDLATGTVVGSIPLESGAGPKGIAVTPDGGLVLVADHGKHTVAEIATATDTVVATIPLNVPSEEIAISPDGTHAYVIGVEDGQAGLLSVATPIDVAGATAGTPIWTAGHFGDVSFLPDGSRAYITHTYEPLLFTSVSGGGSRVDELLPLDLGAEDFGTGLPTYERPEALAIVPNQPPHAAIEGPTTATTGEEVSFDGSKSTDSDGTVARYDWGFGDGTGAANGGPTVHHTFANPGTYQVTLTTTDNEGCSTALVFTGQTAYCNGSDVARTTHEVVVSAPPTAPKTIARCQAVVGNASSFVPKIRPGHVVPGVRVRLAVPTPSRLDVKTKLLWSLSGHKGSAKLQGISVNVRRWRRVRFPVPAGLRDLLPLGTRVTLKLTIRTTPRSGSACSATTTHKTLHVRVVKVFPHAVQANRPR